MSGAEHRPGAAAPSVGPPAEIEALFDALRAVVAADPDLAAVAGGALDRPMTYRGRAPKARPGLAILPAFEGLAAPRTERLMRALMTAAPHLEWRNSYDPDEVGQDFLDRSCWFDVVGPAGPFVCEDLRITSGLWDGGLVYPRHWHRPEEIYCVIAGAGEFISEGMEDRVLSAGETRYHPPGLPHAAAMTAGPLLAFGIWRGEDLMGKPVIDPDWVAAFRRGELDFSTGRAGARMGDAP